MRLRSRQTLLVATVGFFLGCLISLVVLRHLHQLRQLELKLELTQQELAQCHHEGMVPAQQLGPLRQPYQWNDLASHSHLHENVLADNLKSRVRVFCWIMTSPHNHQSKAVHLKATWVKRCNNYVFMSTQVDPALRSIDLNVSEGRDHLWAKTKAAFKYLYDNHLKEYDYFLKADDDTFVVMENLRYMLRNSDPDSGLYAGRRFKPYVKQGYMSGGAGYVLSREALRLFVERAQHSSNSSKCRQDHGGAEDVNVGSRLLQRHQRILPLREPHTDVHSGVLRVPPKAVRRSTRL